MTFPTGSLSGPWGRTGPDLVAESGLPLQLTLLILRRDTSL